MRQFEFVALCKAALIDPNLVVENEAIREYQKDLKVCGYCGAQYYKTNEKYCHKCVGSEYLTEKDYP